jgi:7tm Odorant receptor
MQSNFIDNCIKKHQEVLNLIKISRKLFRIINLIQTGTTLALLAVVTFKLGLQFDFNTVGFVIVFLGNYFQFLTYCLIGELIAMKVRNFQEPSKW